MGEDLRGFLGQRIREERLKKGLSIEELSELADISSSFLGSVERGERALGLDNLIKFSNIFEVTVDSLLKDNVSKESRIYLINQLTENFVDEEFSFVIRIIRDIKVYFDSNKITQNL